MRKHYTKPSLYAERFEVSEHIASCVLVANWGVDCTYTENGLTLFNTSCGDFAVSLWSGANIRDNAQMNFETVKLLNLQCYNSFTGDTSNFFTS